MVTVGSYTSRPKVHFSMDFCLLTKRRGTEEGGAYKNRGRKPLAFKMLDGQRVAISETPVEVVSVREDGLGPASLGDLLNGVQHAVDAPGEQRLLDTGDPLRPAFFVPAALLGDVVQGRDRVGPVDDLLRSMLTVSYSSSRRFQIQCAPSPTVTNRWAWCTPKALR